MTSHRDRCPARLFDALADDYDNLHREVDWEPLVHVKTFVGDASVEGMQILDIGCGTGEVAQWLVQRGAQVTGLDISQKMCELAAERVSGSLFLPWDIGRGLPESMQQKFDITLALGCLEYVADQRALFPTLASSLKKGGKILATFERRGKDTPNTWDESMPLFDQWQRYRISEAELQKYATLLFKKVEIAKINGYYLEEEGYHIPYLKLTASLK